MRGGQVPRPIVFSLLQGPGEVVIHVFEQSLKNSTVSDPTEPQKSPAHGMGGDDDPVMPLMLGEVQGSRGTPKVPFRLAVVNEDIHGFRLQEHLQLAHPLRHQGAWAKDEVGEGWEPVLVPEERAFRCNKSR